MGVTSDSPLWRGEVPLTCRDGNDQYKEYFKVRIYGDEILVECRDPKVSKVEVSRAGIDIAIHLAGLIAEEQSE